MPPRHIIFKKVFVRLCFVKRFHHVTISVFLKPDEKPDFLDILLPKPVKDFFAEQFRYDQNHERTKIYDLPKAQLRVHTAEGFSDELTILTFRFMRKTNVNEVFEKIFTGIGEDGRAALRSEAMLHVDEEGRFFARLDKDAFKTGKYVLTTSGNCVHVAFLIAAFPKNMKTIRATVRALLEEP